MPNPTIATAASMAFALAGCGGSDDPASLFDAQGHPAAKAATEIRTASAAQYRDEALTNSAYTVGVDIEAAGSEAQAIADALAAHAWERANPNAQQAYFVSAADPRTAARVAGVLTALGLPNVFLIDEPSNPRSNPQGESS